MEISWMEGYVFAPDGRCLEATPDWSEGILYARFRLVSLSKKAVAECEV